MLLFGRQDVNAGMVEFQNTTNAVLLDVREDDEFRSGHIPGALNIPLSRIDTITIPKDKPLYVYPESVKLSSIFISSPLCHSRA